MISVICLQTLLVFRNAHKDKGLRLPIFSDSFMLYMGRSPEGATMRELQEHFGLGHSSTSRTCAALVRSGLVQVSRAPEDRRRVVIKLTAKGSRVIDDVLATFRGRRR